MEDWKMQAEVIEMRAARIAYESGLGAGEWEAFLTYGETLQLIKFAEHGYGTWANEPETLARMKSNCERRKSV